MPGFNFDVCGLICRRILAKEASTLILASNYAGAWALLQQHPSAMGVTAPEDSAGAGYGLLHTCLVRNTPDWFMGYVFNRTAESICLESAGRRTGSTALHLACSSSWVRVVKELACVFGVRRDALKTYLPHRGHLFRRTNPGVHRSSDSKLFRVVRSWGLPEGRCSP